MSPSYQTDTTTTDKDVLVVNPSKMEPSSARTMWKKVAFAMVVGGAVVVGNSYGSPMNTPTTEIEAFLSSVSDLKCEKGVSTMYSVLLDSVNTFPGEKVCGQLCATPRTAQFIFPFAPPPKPEKGDCASFGFTIGTAKSFDLGFAKASIFQRPKFSRTAGNTCASGYSPITSKWQDCKAAAVELGFSGDSVGYVDYMTQEYNYFSDRPQGCFKSTGNGRIAFNNGPGGSGRGDDSIICSV